MEKNKTSIEILKVLLKQFTIKWTITSLAKEINISRVGIWKVLKRLETVEGRGRYKGKRRIGQSK